MNILLIKNIGPLGAYYIYYETEGVIRYLRFRYDTQRIEHAGHVANAQHRDRYIQMKLKSYLKISFIGGQLKI